MMISGARAQAGRDLLGWSLLTMSAKCELGAAVIEQFESGERKLKPFEVLAIRLALEAGGVEFETNGATRLWRGRVQWEERRMRLIQSARHALGSVLFLAAAGLTVQNFAHQSTKHHYSVIIVVCIGVLAVGLLRAWATDEGQTSWTRQVRKRDGVAG
jgi:hypothetical protein